jgi:hypothetical protein
MPSRSLFKRLDLRLKEINPDFLLIYFQILLANIKSSCIFALAISNDSKTK